MAQRHPRHARLGLLPWPASLLLPLSAIALYVVLGRLLPGPTTPNALPLVALLPVAAVEALGTRHVLSGRPLWVLRSLACLVALGTLALMVLYAIVASLACGGTVC